MCAFGAFCCAGRWRRCGLWSVCRRVRIGVIAGLSIVFVGVGMRFVRHNNIIFHARRDFVAAVVVVILVVVGLDVVS